MDDQEIPDCNGLDCSAKAEALMTQTALIDGHNDLPWQIYNRYSNQLSRVDLDVCGTCGTLVTAVWFDARLRY